jgi:Rrf2 family protein
MWLSSTAQQAIHAVVCIAGSGNGGPVRVDEIAAATDSPRNYLSKTLHLLTRARVLRSERGPRGGFRLAIPADRLTLARIIAPFEPVSNRRCLVGQPRCSDARPCAVHDQWKNVADAVDNFFSKTTVHDLVAGNPRAAAETREMIISLRNSLRRTSNESIA